VGRLPCSLLGGSAFIRDSTKGGKVIRPIFGSVMGKCGMERRKRHEVRNPGGKSPWAPWELHSFVRRQKTGILSHCCPEGPRRIPKNPQNLEKVNASIQEGLGQKFGEIHFPEGSKCSFGKERKGPGDRRGKSFRCGIPSSLENFPENFCENHLKSLGRWRSHAYQRYMRNHEPEFKWVFQKIADRLLTSSFDC
jgi:hypothetical protein